MSRQVSQTSKAIKERRFRKREKERKRFEGPLRKFIEHKYNSIFQEYTELYNLMVINHPNTRNLTKTTTFRNWLNTLHQVPSDILTTVIRETFGEHYSEQDEASNAPKSTFKIKRTKHLAPKSTFKIKRTKHLTPKSTFKIKRTKHLTPKSTFKIKRTKHLAPKSTFKIKRTKHLTPKLTFKIKRTKHLAPKSTFKIKRTKHLTPKSTFKIKRTKHLAPKSTFKIKRTTS